MPNDAKLGFLAGVAGVVVTAVLFYQAPPVGPTAKPATSGASTSPVAGKPGGQPTRSAQAATRPTDSTEPSPPRGRPELSVQPVSRTASADDE